MTYVEETIEDRLKDGMRKDLILDDNQCIGVRHPDFPRKKDGDVWIVPPHLAMGYVFNIANSPAGRGISSRCDTCQALYKLDRSTLLVAYKPDDTRVPVYHPKKPYQVIPETIPEYLDWPAPVAPTLEEISKPASD